MITFLICIVLYIAHVLICRQIWIWTRLTAKDKYNENEVGVVCSLIPMGILILIMIFISIIIPEGKIDKFFTPKKYRK